MLIGLETSGLEVIIWESYDWWHCVEWGQRKNMLWDGNVKDKWKMRSSRRLPKEEPQWWKPSQRRVVMEKVRKNNLEKKSNVCCPTDSDSDHSCLGNVGSWWSWNSNPNGALHMKVRMEWTKGRRRAERNYRNGWWMSCSRGSLKQFLKKILFIYF